MRKLYKNFATKILFITIILGSFLIISNKSLAEDIDYQSLKNTVYNFLYQQCPCSGSEATCLKGTLFEGELCSSVLKGPVKYKTELLNANTDEEIREVLNNFFTEYCNEKYTSGSSSYASVLKSFCDCWKNPTPNCTNLINTIGSQVPPGASNPIGPINVSNWITNYQAGQTLGKKLEEDTSCQGNLRITLWGLITSPLHSFLTFIFWVFNGLMKLLADVFIWLLTPQNFGGFVNFPPVKTIWKVSRDLGNIGIILGFVLMAVATILKIEKYSWEKLLWRLVLVALLINFSLVLCGIFVDLSNFLTIYFINGAGSENISSFKDLLTYTATRIACSGKETEQGVIATNTTVLLGIVFEIIIIGQIVGLIFYTIIRIVTLWITLGLSPLFILSLAFPGLEKLADNWKNYFTQAIISLPIIAFSFFIVLLMLNQVAISFSKNTEANFSVKIVSLISYGLIIIVLSQAILTIAGALGIQNIQKGYQFATKLIWGGLGLAAGYAWGRASRNVVSSESWRKTAEALEKANAGILSGWVHNIGEKMKKMSEQTNKAEISKLEEESKRMDNDKLRRKARDLRGIGKGGVFGYRRKVAVLVKELINRGEISEEDDDLIEYAKDYLSPADILTLKKVNPQLYIRHFGDTFEKEQYNEAYNKALKELGLEGKDIKTLKAEEKKKIQTTIEKELLPSVAASLKEDKLREGNWSDNFESIEKNLGEDKLLEVLRNLVHRLPPSAMAQIFQSMKPAKQQQYMEKLLKAIKDEALTAKMTPAEYLLEYKGYKSIRYFQGILGQK